MRLLRMEGFVNEQPKWWSLVPVGAVLSKIDTTEGLVEFRVPEIDNIGPIIYGIDLFTDEVLYVLASI